MSHPPEADLEITLPARAENVGVVRHVLGGIGDVLAIHPEVLDDIRLAVSEACTNAVVHAYAGGPAGHLDVLVTTGDDEVEIVVRDHGAGMAPRADSPGLGVGLPLIASLTRALELSSTEGGGTEVRMVFSLAHPQHEHQHEQAAAGADEANGS